MSGSVDGLDVSRAVEIIVGLPSGPGGTGRRGSGYRVTGTAVLTAGHVVRDAAWVRVRCNADTLAEWTVDARVVAAVNDVAVLAVDRSDEISPVRYGRIGELDAVVACTGLGFPRFKMRDDGLNAYRDLCHLVGSSPVLSNRRSGTLEIMVAQPPERDPNPARSPWEGMSGAPVFAAGRLIAVITGNHAAEGVGRLEAARLDDLYDFEARPVRIALGLPTRRRDLPDVVPSQPRSLELDAHRAEVASIAPTYLRDRDAELEELTEFCSGPEPYTWWQAGPWAGKTALASSFAVKPPAGVRVASFFVTARLSGQADAAAYGASMIRQLADIAERPVPAEAGGMGLLALLVTEAAERCAQRGERLLVIVDGLDEDQGVKPSIAALLPRRPPDALRVLVMSRHHPGLPDDVPGDHPLRHCRVRDLDRSTYAQHLEFRAREELKDLIQSGQDGYEVVALITASGGGLTVADLADLTGRRYHEIDWHIHSVFGRSLTSRSFATDAVFLFAHETLRDTAEETLAAELPAFRVRLHAWADRYRDEGWPEETPRYLFAPYARLLASVEDTDRLIELALDRRRHERMLTHSRTDHAALTEVAEAERLLAHAPDLTRHAVLAVERERLADRSMDIPETLAVAWVRLGYLAHAAEISAFLSVEGLAEYGVALVEAGEHDKAAEVARRTPEYDMLKVWIALLKAAVAENPDPLGPLVAETLTTIESMGSYSITFDLFVELVHVLRPFPEHASRIADKGRLLLRQADTVSLNRLLFELAIAPAEPDRALVVMQEFGSLSEAAQGEWADQVVRALARTASVADQPAVAELMGRVEEVLESSWTELRLEKRVSVAAALAEVDPARGLRLAKECLSEIALSLETRPSDVDQAWEDLGMDYAWHELAGVIVRTADPQEAQTLLLSMGLPLRGHVEAACVLIEQGRFDEPAQGQDLMLQVFDLARGSDERAELLARLAAAAARANLGYTVPLAKEAEQAGRERPVPEVPRHVRDDLILGMLALGRPAEAEALFLTGDVSAWLITDLAIGQSRTSPQDTIRLLDGIETRSRWECGGPRRQEGQ